VANPPVTPPEACNGVRHIKSGHGFDGHTESCVGKIIAADHRSTSNSNSGNWMYLQVKAVSDPELGVLFLKGYVIVSKATNRIVTAYTRPQAWGLCSQAF
jgi:hypothetical protein